MKSMLLGGALCLFSSVCALAADMGVPPMSVPLAPPPFTWTGCYAGAQASGGWGQKNLNDTNGICLPLLQLPESIFPFQVGYVGGQIGCDYQFASELGGRHRGCGIRRKYRRQYQCRLCRQFPATLSTLM